MANIPQVLQNFSVYHGGNRYWGIATVELPKLEQMSATLKGAGMSGEIEAPVVGHVSAMTAKVEMRVVEDESLSLAVPEPQLLTFRGAIQAQDPETQAFRSRSLKVTMVCTPKSFEPGKFEVGNTMDTSAEVNVSYYKMELDKKTVLEVDPINYVYIVNGKDYLSKQREILGF